VSPYSYTCDCSCRTKIVDAKKKDYVGRTIGKIHNPAQNRLASRLYSQPSGEPGAAFATGCQANGGDLLAVPDRHPGPRFHKSWETFSEYFPRAK